MRRADRLFQLVHLVRGRRLSTGGELARRLQVSLRTVYRDIAALQHQGVPIEGEAGVGYRMRAGFDLAPLMFTPAEAQALVAALRVAQPRLDSALAPLAETALAKVMAVLPPAARAAAEALPVFAPPLDLGPLTRERLALLRQCTEGRRKLVLDYRDQEDRTTQRTVRPLACLHWESTWTLAAWCELRQAFRSFRVDRIGALRALDETFRDEPGKTLADLLRAVDTPP